MSPEQVRLLARYLPVEFRGDWDPIWGHPLDTPEEDRVVADSETKS